MKTIITICLMALYMLSMAHTLFHHQMHLMLAHADNIEQLCDCHCSSHNHSHSDALDHTHENPDERDCKSTTQFIPASDKPEIPIIHIDTNTIFALSNELLALMEQNRDNTFYVDYAYLLPLEPDIATQSLRAPPALC